MKVWILSWLTSFGMKSFYVGSRVTTKFGTGVVTGGSIRVKYDRQLPGQHKNDKSWVHDLTEITEN